MNATAIITFSITVAGFVFTMITLVAKLDRLIEKESRQ